MFLENEQQEEEELHSLKDKTSVQIHRCNMDTSICRLIITEVYVLQQLLNDSNNGDKNMEEF